MHRIQALLWNSSLDRTVSLWLEDLWKKWAKIRIKTAGVMDSNNVKVTENEI